MENGTVASPGGRPRVVVVGAGFAGLFAARRLARGRAEVVLVDKNNYHTFLPLLYQVAAAELETEQIAYPVRGIFRRAKNLTFYMAEVTGRDPERKVLFTDGPEIPYDYLVFAPGSVTNFFGVEGAAEHAFRLKYLEQAVNLRNHILERFEAAMLEPDPARTRRMLTFAVVGGGPTGVEYAGALAELIRGPLAKDFPAAVAGQARVLLLEAAPNILTGFPPELSAEALTRLRKKGVEVRLGAQVARVGPDFVELTDSSRIPTQTVAWTAGVMGHPLAERMGLELGRLGRALARPDLSAKNDPCVFLAGDICEIEGGDPLPMIAPTAIQQGRHAAKNVLRAARGRTPVAFSYLDKGTMATIGRGEAVVRLGSRTFAGFFAWITWLVVHLLYLVGFRNRLVVLINWAWDYFLFERAVRLIVPRHPPREDASPPGKRPDR